MVFPLCFYSTKHSEALDVAGTAGFTPVLRSSWKGSHLVVCAAQKCAKPRLCSVVELKFETPIQGLLGKKDWL